MRHLKQDFCLLLFFVFLASITLEIIVILWYNYKKIRKELLSLCVLIK